MGIFILKRKSFTLYDDTDNLKRMKDSDILAEKKKRKPSYTPVLTSAAGGAVGGAAAGALAEGAVRILTKGKRGASSPTLRQAMARSAKSGAIIGTGIGLISGSAKRRPEAEEVEDYNERLEYAQRQAMRREKKDWKQNMTLRDGYSY